MVFDPALHVGDEELEQFSLGQLGAKAHARLEQHLIICESCRVKVEEQTAYTDAMRHAANAWRSSHPLTKRRRPARREPPPK